jgi:hypothetical protein
VASALHGPGLAQIYFIFRGPELAGYFTLTFCFSLEFHGRFALFDELYLREPYADRSWGKPWSFLRKIYAEKLGSKRCALRSVAKTSRRNPYIGRLASK